MILVKESKIKVIYEAFDKAIVLQDLGLADQNDRIDEKGLFSYDISTKNT